MRGRATSVALPAVVVVVLVAIVAIAATGETPRSDGATRPPSESLLDAIFTLWLVAVACGGVLLLYGLAQRKAIAEQVASGRYRRMSLVGYLAFFGLFAAFSYWRLSVWEPPEPEAPGELAFPGRTPQPTTPERETPQLYEPSVSWVPIAVVVGLVVAGVLAYVLSERRAKRGGRSDRDVLEQLIEVLDETLDDLRAMADPRSAIIAAYARMERVLAVNGVPRSTSETPDEYLSRVLHDLELDSGAFERLTALFREAKFSHHDVNDAMKEEAISALEEVRDELRLAGGQAEPPQATTSPIEAGP